MKLLASKVIRKYGTNDPFEIAAKNDVIIICEPLGNINGYFNRAHGQKFIHINDDLLPYFQKYIVAHLLYQAVTDPDQMMFNKRKKATRFTETETQANMFALNLLLSEEELNKKSVHDVFAMFDVSEEEQEDLFARLYKLWDKEHKMTREELLRHVLSCTR